MPYLENTSYFGTLLITEVQRLTMFIELCSKNINVNFCVYMNERKNNFTSFSGRSVLSIDGSIRDL